MKITTTGLEFETKGSNLVIQGDKGAGTITVKAKFEGMIYSTIYEFTEDGFKIITLPTCTIQVDLTGGASYSIQGKLNQVA